MAQRTPDEIEREIELTRVYLADTVDAIATKVNPKNVAERATTKVKERIAELTHGGVDPTSKAIIPGPDATTFHVTRHLRKDRVAIAGGAVAGVVGLVLAIRKWRHR